MRLAIWQLHILKQHNKNENFATVASIVRWCSDFIDYSTISSLFVWDDDNELLSPPSPPPPHSPSSASVYRVKLLMCFQGIEPYLLCLCKFYQMRAWKSILMPSKYMLLPYTARLTQKLNTLDKGIRDISMNIVKITSTEFCKDKWEPWQ